MSDYDVDLFVIGAGSGGVRAARMAAQYGAKVAIAEESRYGGTCVIRGCVPKKLMVYASSFAEHFEDARGFGWDVGEPTFDWGKLKANRDAEIDRLEGIYRNLLNNSGVTMHDQRATVVDAHTVALADGTKITAKYTLIATGGRPNVLPFEGAEHVIVSDDIFLTEKQPERVVIVGGGYIALEFACIYNGLGTDVTVVNRSPTVLREFDGDVQRHLIEEMEKKGIKLHLGATPVSVADNGGTKTLTLSDGIAFEAETIFVATGRKPNIDGLGLENLGMKLTGKGAIAVDGYSQTSVPSIYAVGDVTDRAALTPVAIREGAAFVETVFNNNPMSADHDLIPTAIFTQPEIGTAGMGEEEAREKHEIDVYRASFRPMLHTLSGRDEKMLMKLIVDKASDKVIGVHIIGHGSGEMIQCLGIALKMGATKADFDRTMAVHPTAAEELVTMKTPV